MRTRYRLTRRGSRGDTLYCVDTKTCKRTSLQTTSAEGARQIIEAKNQAERQPILDLQIAKAYLAGTDNGIITRTWRNAMATLSANIWSRLCDSICPTLLPAQTVVSPYIFVSIQEHLAIDYCTWTNQNHIDWIGSRESGKFTDPCFWGSIAEKHLKRNS
jgi:hypothetical protein